MITLTNGKTRIHLTITETDKPVINDVTRKVIPTGMFPLDENGDYVVDDINEYLVRAIGWMNEDENRTGIRMIQVESEEVEKDTAGTCADE